MARVRGNGGQFVGEVEQQEEETSSCVNDGFVQEEMRDAQSLTMVIRTTIAMLAWGSDGQLVGGDQRGEEQSK